MSSHLDPRMSYVCQYLVAFLSTFTLSLCNNIYIISLDKAHQTKEAKTSCGGCLVSRDGHHPVRHVADKQIDGERARV